MSVVNATFLGDRASMHERTTHKGNRMRKIAKLAALAVAMAPGTLLADDVNANEPVEMKVIVAGDAHSSDTIHWSSDDFNMDGLAVGESRTIENPSGRTLTLTRTDGGMEVTVDGETVVVPDMTAHISMAQIGDIDVDVDGNNAVAGTAVAIAGTHATRAFPPEGVTIMSSEPLDSSVRESIRSVLISAGIDEEVRFIDGSEERREIHVIKHVETL